jgi:membrane-bound lytic murein transglycosylase A
MRLGFSLAACAAALMCGCVSNLVPPPPLVLESVGFEQIPGWSQDRLVESIAGLKAECHRLALLPPDTMLGGQGLAAAFGGKAGQWAAPCQAAMTLTVNDATGLRRFYEARFQPYRVQAAGMFTGYYEPEVKGAMSPGNGFTVPLLARPSNLIQRTSSVHQPGAAPVVGRLAGGTMVPYWTRSEIEAGAMGEAARPLLWLRDPVDLFFLQIQGAGRVRLPDGTVVRVGYDGKNGRAYTPIGQVLVAQHAMAAADVSMQTIKAWLAAHPAEAKSVMDRNDDYVFFRILKTGDAALGPPGALGVDLTAGRSVAVDPHYLPLSAPLFIDTKDPLSGAPWQHLVLAQDSGTDIKGAARADIFFGFGVLAEQEAGRMHKEGAVYLLLPRPSKGEQF